MGRHEMQEGPHIKIAYGYDPPLKGYFMSVEDTRFKWSSEAPKAVNEICESVCADGGGHYFDCNTYAIGGFGHRVSVPTMLVFMERFGVPQAHLEQVRAGREI